MTKMQLIADGATLAAAGAKNLSGTPSRRRRARRNRHQLPDQGPGDADRRLADRLARLSRPPTTSVKVNVKAEVKGSLINVLDAIENGAEIGYGNGGNQAGTSGGRKFDLDDQFQGELERRHQLPLPAGAERQQTPNALEVKGTADIEAKNCSIWDNSARNAGLYQNGNATITRRSRSTCVGSYVGQQLHARRPRPARLPRSPIRWPRSSYRLRRRHADRLAGVRRHGSGQQVNMPTSLRRRAPERSSPRHLQGRHRRQEQSHRHMKPGIYFIEDGDLISIQSGGIVNATGGVTII